MKILLLVVLSASLSMATLASSQSQSGSQASQGNQSQGAQNQTNSNADNQNMSGKVSHDHKSITNDKDSKNYKVDNPETLKGKEDQHVALVVAVDPENNVVHIIQVEPPQ
jgi:hypothetical protein